jgi:hypothetical protein
MKTNTRIKEKPCVWGPVNPILPYYDEGYVWISMGFPAAGSTIYVRGFLCIRKTTLCYYCTMLCNIHAMLLIAHEVYTFSFFYQCTIFFEVQIWLQK